MSEHHPEPAADAGEATGHPAVDEVVAALAALDDLPVEEHVAVFEAAHDTLRRTLADAADGPASH